jgi:hypothetical protein
MSNKAILIAITAVVITASGIFILAKSRPADIQSNVNTSSASSSLNSVIVKNLQSSSSSSVVVSSSVTVSYVVETPTVDAPAVVESKPVVQAPTYAAPQNTNGNETYKPKPVRNNLGTCEGWDFNAQNIIQTNGECFSLEFMPLSVGEFKFTNFDYSFLNENINDVAIFYHDSVRNVFPTNKHYIKSFNIQKVNNFDYIISISAATKNGGEGGIESFYKKYYKFTRTNDHDGVFEELFNFNAPDFFNVMDFTTQN